MMSEKTGKTKAIIDLAASNQRMRELLKKVAGIVEAALANQPEGDGSSAWRHLGAAVVNVRDALRPKPGTLAFEDEMALYKKQIEELRAKYGAGCEKPLDPNAPEMVRGGEPDEKKAIGNFAGVGKVVSYAIGRDMTVTVTARTATGNGDWFFEGIKDGKIVISGCIFGGKWAAAQYCKFLKNGIVSRANRLYHAHHKAKKETT